MFKVMARPSEMENAGTGIVPGYGDLILSDRDHGVGTRSTEATRRYTALSIGVEAALR